MKFKTQSGSLYETREVDGTSQIRRISGTHDPTPLQGPDGIWKPFTSGQIRVGSRVVIMWPEFKATLTSPVTEILN